MAIRLNIIYRCLSVSHSFSYPFSMYIDCFFLIVGISSPQRTIAPPIRNLNILVTTEGEGCTVVDDESSTSCSCSDSYNPAFLSNAICAGSERILFAVTAPLAAAAGTPMPGKL